MNIFIENNKFIAVIETGSRDEFNKFTDAINSGINFYLCRDPFRPITQDQAGNIYFLKWLEKCLYWKTSLHSKDDFGKIICDIPKNDLCLLHTFQDSINETVKDIIDNETDREIEFNWSEKIRLLKVLTKALNLDKMKTARENALQLN